MFTFSFIESNRLVAGVREPREREREEKTRSRASLVFGIGKSSTSFQHSGFQTSLGNTTPDESIISLL